MCGIAGWRLTSKAPESFYLYLAVVMEDRGGEAYGFYDGSQVLKGAERIVFGLPVRSMATLDGFLHTRYGTTGANTAENAHPFTVGGLVGAHNGTLANHRAMNDKHKRTCSVDSQHIFEHISAGLPLSELEGYGAIEYVLDGAWYIGACNSGSLEVAKTSLGVVWASTRAAIVLACDNSGLSIEYFYEVEQGKLYRVEADALYSTDKVFDLSMPAKVIKWDDKRVSEPCIAGIKDCKGSANCFCKWSGSASGSGISGESFSASMAWESDMTADEIGESLIADLENMLADDSITVSEHIEAGEALKDAQAGDFTAAESILVDYYGEAYLEAYYGKRSPDAEPGQSKPFSCAHSGYTCQSASCECGCEYCAAAKRIAEPAQSEAKFSSCEWCGHDRMCTEVFDCFICADCVKVCH